jgi:23S rRNA pseudouridine2605 synthase
VERTYQVTVAGDPTRQDLDRLRQGVHLAEGRVQVARLRVRRRRSSSTILEMVLTEGRNREIRRMAARIGHKVLSLKRTGFGPLRLGDLPPGAYRELSGAELRTLRRWLDRATGGEASGVTSVQNRGGPRPITSSGRGKSGRPGKRRPSKGSRPARFKRGPRR